VLRLSPVTRGHRLVCKGALADLRGLLGVGLTPENQVGTYLDAQRNHSRNGELK